MNELEINIKTKYSTFYITPQHLGQDRNVANFQELEKNVEKAISKIKLEIIKTILNIFII